MPARLKIQISLASLLVVALAIHCMWLWQPERQVLKHQQHFLAAAENKSWTKFAGFIDPQYSDRWGHDKTFVVREASEWLRQFFSLTIQSDPASLQMGDNRATITSRIRLVGNGTALATIAQNEVNAIAEPFVFEWTRKSWKPWDWTLTRADNANPRFGAQVSTGGF